VFYEVKCVSVFSGPKRASHRAASAAKWQKLKWQSVRFQIGWLMVRAHPAALERKAAF
jgi:hypothetical protein